MTLNKIGNLPGWLRQRAITRIQAVWYRARGWWGGRAPRRRGLRCWMRSVAWLTDRRIYRGNGRPAGGAALGPVAAVFGAMGGYESTAGLFNGAALSAVVALARGRNNAGALSMLGVASENFSMLPEISERDCGDVAPKSRVMEGLQSF